jgi:hypothetical protein
MCQCYWVEVRKGLWKRSLFSFFNVRPQGGKKISAADILAKYFIPPSQSSNIEGEIICRVSKPELSVILFRAIFVTDRHVDAANGCLLACV